MESRKSELTMLTDAAGSGARNPRRTCEVCVYQCLFIAAGPTTTLEIAREEKFGFVENQSLASRTVIILFIYLLPAIQHRWPSKNGGPSQ